MIIPLRVTEQQNRFSTFIETNNIYCLTIFCTVIALLLHCLSCMFIKYMSVSIITVITNSVPNKLKMTDRYPALLKENSA
jgi:hypothetical protein